jgi:hypothetical protein
MSEALEGLFRSPRSIPKANGPREMRSVPPQIFTRCGLALGTVSLGAPSWEGLEKPSFLNILGESGLLFRNLLYFRL